MKVTILSGTGWVGSHIAKEFIEHGYEVTVLARGKTKPMFDLPGMKVIPCERTNIPQLKECLNQLQTDIFIDVIPGHLGTENTVAIADMIEGKVGQYLHCGSTGVYAPLRRVPGRETDPLTLPKEFGEGWRGKAWADEEIRRRMAQGFPATILQPSCIMGAGTFPMDNFGSRDPQFLKNLVEGKPIILPDGGNMLIHFIHPADLARSFRLAAETKNSLGQTYIISCERSLTVKDYILELCDLLGCTPNFVPMHSQEVLEKYISPRNEGGFRFFCTHMSFDISKAKTQLGYVPQYDVTDMLQELIAWVKQQPESGF